MSGILNLKWLRYNKNNLPAVYKAAAEKYAANGAVKKVGPIKSIEILHRQGSTTPVHQSSFNKADKNLIISARITPADGSKPRTHHIYANGTGTIKKGDRREFSTGS